MRVERQIRRYIPDLMLRILGIVPAEKGPGALAMLAVDELDPGRAWFVGQHRHARLEGLARERRREAVEVRDDLAVTLHQHRGHGIDLRAEIEQGERPERLPAIRR